MPQDATLVSAKELFAKKIQLLSILHLFMKLEKNSKCINLNTLMYFQYKYFKYNLCNIGIQFEVYKFTLYMDNELIVFYSWPNNGTVMAIQL
jgi:hypothetical protein